MPPEPDILDKLGPEPDMLYEICPVCEGTGTLRVNGNAKACTICKPLRVTEVGITMRRVEQLMWEKIRKDALPKENG